MTFIGDHLRGYPAGHVLTRLVTAWGIKRRFCGYEPDWMVRWRLFSRIVSGKR